MNTFRLVSSRLSMALAMPVLFCSAALADDWPMFGRDATRNGVSPEKGAPLHWTVDLTSDGGAIGSGQNIKWSVKLGSMTVGDPVVADGIVWVGTNNDERRDPRGTYKSDASVLLALRESDGKLLYRYESPRLRGSRFQDWPGSSLACSPLIEGDRVWFTTNRCETVCLDVGALRRGHGKPQLLWKVDMVEELGVFPRSAAMHFSHLCSVASFEDFIYVITNNGVSRDFRTVPAPDAPSVVCFAKYTGKVVWMDASPGENLLLSQWSSALVANIDGRPQVIAPQGDGWLRSFDARTGKLIWEFDSNPKSAKWAPSGRGTRNDLPATPVFYENRVYIGNGSHPEAGGGPAWLYCLDPTKQGDISLELPAGPSQGKPNPNSGVVWRYGGKETFNRTVANVTIHDGLLIAADLYGLVHCLDAKTGQPYWVHETESGLFGSPLIVDGKVYLGDEDGQVWIFALARQKKVLAKIDMGSTIYCSPIFANGVLYVATRTRLFAIAGDAKKERTDPIDASSVSIRQPRGPRAAYTPTPRDVVETMLKLAKVTEDDVVYDLGSGDGRIVIAAAQKYGCKAVGYEIDAELVTDSKKSVEAKKLEHLVTIERHDLFDVDLAPATVVTLYLLPRMNEKLIPQLAKLKSGSRIVAHEFPIPGVKPVRVLEVESVEDLTKRSVFLYRTPLEKQTKP